MQVVLQGSLRHFGAAELLSFLCGRGRSGTLDCESAGRKTRLFFENDRIVWAEGPRNDPAEAVLELFDWTAGNFTLLDSVVLPDGVTRVAIEVPSLIEEAKRRAESAGVYPDDALFHVVDDPALQQQVSLAADEFKLLFRIAAGRSFKDLAFDLAVPRRELGERVKKLVSIGLIAVAAPEPPPSAVLHSATVRTPAPKTISRRRTLIGSLTPDNAPDTVHPLLEPEYTIGRASANGIVIQDGSVSGTHARITRKPEGFFIEDLQSRNGTFINGEKVTEKRLLSDGDLIRVGKIIMTFNVAREEKAGDTTQPESRLL